MRRLRPIPVLIGLLLVAALALALWPRLAGRPTGPDNGPGTAAVLAGSFTLAVSWEPAFCATEPRRPECRSQTLDRFDAHHLSLHGLWPEPQDNVYCRVAGTFRNADTGGDWRLLPEPELTPATRDRLATVMPGAQSLLDRHEWIKHGTCARTDAETYYRAAIALLDALDRAGIGSLFAAHVGDRLTAADLRAAFDKAFGPDAGRRVTLECDRVGGRTLAAELRIAVKGEIGPALDLKKLIAAAPTVDRGCPAGEIDAVGE